jgi:hypothetical protein
MRIIAFWVFIFNVNLVKFLRVIGLPVAFLGVPFSIFTPDFRRLGAEVFCDRHSSKG